MYLKYAGWVVNSVDPDEVSDLGLHCLLQEKKRVYHIRPYYRTYSYKCTVKQFRSHQITAYVLFVYFFIKAYIVGTHNRGTHNICLYKEGISMQFKRVTTTYAFIKKLRKKIAYTSSNKPFDDLFFFKCTLSLVDVYFTTSFPSNFEKLKCTVW